MNFEQYFKRLQLIMALLVNGNFPQDNPKLAKATDGHVLRYVRMGNGYRFITVPVVMVDKQSIGRGENPMIQHIDELPYYPEEASTPA